jgi:hypothetical protein
VTEEGTRASMLHHKRQEAAARVLAIGQDIEDLGGQVEELGRNAHAPQDTDIEQPCDACPRQQLAPALVAAAAAGADETVATQESAADARAPTRQARGETAGSSASASPLYSRIIAALAELSSHYQSTVSAFKLGELGDEVALDAGGRAPSSSGERLRAAADLDQAQSVAAAGHLKPWPSQTAPHFSPLPPLPPLAPLPPRPPALEELTHAGIAPAEGLGFLVQGAGQAGQTEVVGHVGGKEEGGERGQ